MVVIVLENVKPSLRGEVSRWLFEIKAGIFTGRLSALVRDELWGAIVRDLCGGSAVMVYPANTEQGFTAKTCGDPSRRFIDIEGLLLVKT